jgi:drug/metabolite transporter (DMT)-like permease
VGGNRQAAVAWVRVGVLALLWGSTYLWIELALTGLSPLHVTAARCALGALTLTAWRLAARQRLPRDRTTWRHIIVAAFLCNALPFALFSFGQQSVDSGFAGVLSATTPLWSLLFGLATGAERGLRPVRLGGLLLGFVGVVLICAPWRQGASVGWGALAILAAAASYAVAFTYMGRNLVGKGTATISLSAAQLIAATGWATLALPAGGPPAARINLIAAAAVLALGILATGVTFHLTYRIIADEGATDAAAVGYLLPVVSVLLGALALGEELSVLTIAGMAVVLVGVAMTRRRRPPAASQVEPAGSRPPAALAVDRPKA